MKIPILFILTAALLVVSGIRAEEDVKIAIHSEFTVKAEDADKALNELRGLCNDINTALEEAGAMQVRTVADRCLACGGQKEEPKPEDKCGCNKPTNKDGEERCGCNKPTNKDGEERCGCNKPSNRDGDNS